MTQRTARRRSGDRTEDAAVGYLVALGWSVVARNVAVGKDEVDIVAVDPGPPTTVVCVEVRGNRTGRFGAPEESVVGRKIAKLYRSMAALRAGRAALPDGVVLAAHATWRVDLVTIEHAPLLAADAGGPVVRHLRGVEPG